MSSIALDIRDAADHPDTPPAGPAPAPDDDVTGRPATPAARTRTAPARVRCAHCGTVLATDPDRPTDAREATDTAGDFADPDVEPDDNGSAMHAEEAAPTPIPVHALDPAPATPFTAVTCPGSGRGADPRTGDVPETKPDPAPAPATTLPPGLHWRSQPFSHRGY
ncbi:hypothetical protein GCM10023205_46160 [Yinghuangia aomiensis]|uniref:Uncharacterized protein n=1 Tax=Yinghuangia aomiensis TaxID=676205 RepID=A0ABP9HN11_9ACTN